MNAAPKIATTWPETFGLVFDPLAKEWWHHGSPWFVRQVSASVWRASREDRPGCTLLTSRRRTPHAVALDLSAQFADLIAQPEAA